MRGLESSEKTSRRLLQTKIIDISIQNDSSNIFLKLRKFSKH